jgi:hypothetical protein
MNKRIAKKKLNQFYDEREELLGWLRDLNISCDSEYPIHDVNEWKKEHKSSDDWLQELGGKVDNHFRLERARLMNAIR